MRKMNELKHIFIFFIILLMSVSLFSTKLDNYVYSFEPDELIRKSDKNLNALGLYLKYIETGNQAYKNTANMLRSENMESLSSDDSIALNILSESMPYNYSFIQNRLRNALNNYDNSVILNSLFTTFSFRIWEKERSLSLEQTIIEKTKKIEENIGLNPLSAYYFSYIKWYSKYIAEPGESFTKLNNIYKNFPENKSIIELLTTISFESQRYEDLKNLYEIYTNFIEKNDRTMLIFAKGFQKLENNSQSIKILENVIEQSNNKYVLSSSYELMGDISNTNSQKILYYKTSLDYDPQNPNSLFKLANSYYEEDKKKNLNMVRILLQKSLHFNKDNKEAQLLLKKINFDFMVENFLINILPYFLFFSFVFFFTYYLLIKKSPKERTEISDEEHEN
ncbi:hypothetical protein SAMN04488588_0347 [Geotoga petraea]|uniref:Tetratricopeptide repeat protein n=2 Tax=Geotoga petraea TaxID=28234 RepID=A0A1G6IEH3_9BACT|nr:hypothetical protein [Geotoga petraea]TGG89181.1 hypothetical protein E4650_03030 [Geotoga petraea]SDC04810.1 hypothetical protein SAMN04488588_0347 [Geotoga petraea]